MYMNYKQNIKRKSLALTFGLLIWAIYEKLINAKYSSAAIVSKWLIDLAFSKSARVWCYCSLGVAVYSTRYLCITTQHCIVYVIYLMSCICLWILFVLICFFLGLLGRVIYSRIERVVLIDRMFRLNKMKKSNICC